MKTFMSTATKILIDLPFDELQPPRKNFLPHWQGICDQELGSHQAPIVESSLYYAVGSSDEPELVLAYFGQRVMGPTGTKVWLSSFSRIDNP
jgi:hypothetical protein